MPWYLPCDVQQTRVVHDLLCEVCQLLPALVKCKSLPVVEAHTYQHCQSRSGRKRSDSFALGSAFKEATTQFVILYAENLLLHFL